MKLYALLAAALSSNARVLYSELEAGVDCDQCIDWRGKNSCWAKMPATLEDPAGWGTSYCCGPSDIKCRGLFYCSDKAVDRGLKILSCPSNSEVCPQPYGDPRERFSDSASVLVESSNLVTWRKLSWDEFAVKQKTYCKYRIRVSQVEGQATTLHLYLTKSSAAITSRVVRLESPREFSDAASESWEFERYAKIESLGEDHEAWLILEPLVYKAGNFKIQTWVTRTESDEEKAPSTSDGATEDSMGSEGEGGSADSSGEDSESSIGGSGLTDSGEEQSGDEAPHSESQTPPSQDGGHPEEDKNGEFPPYTVESAPEPSETEDNEQTARDPEETPPADSHENLPDSNPKPEDKQDDQDDNIGAHPKPHEEEFVDEGENSQPLSPTPDKAPDSHDEEESREEEVGSSPEGSDRIDSSEEEESPPHQPEESRPAPEEDYPTTNETDTESKGGNEASIENPEPSDDTSPESEEGSSPPGYENETSNIAEEPEVKEENGSIATTILISALVGGSIILAYHFVSQRCRQGSDQLSASPAAKNDGGGLREDLSLLTPIKDEEEGNSYLHGDDSEGSDASNAELSAANESDPGHHSHLSKRSRHSRREQVQFESELDSSSEVNKQAIQLLKSIFQNGESSVLGTMALQSQREQDQLGKQQLTLINELITHLRSLNQKDEAMQFENGEQQHEGRSQAEPLSLPEGKASAGQHINHDNSQEGSEHEKPCFAPEEAKSVKSIAVGSSLTCSVQEKAASQLADPKPSILVVKTDEDARSEESEDKPEEAAPKANTEAHPEVQPSSPGKSAEVDQFKLDGATKKMSSHSHSSHGQLLSSTSKTCSLVGRALSNKIREGSPEKKHAPSPSPCKDRPPMKTSPSPKKFQVEELSMTRDQVQDQPQAGTQPEPQAEHSAKGSGLSSQNAAGALIDRISPLQVEQVVQSLQIYGEYQQHVENPQEELQEEVKTLKKAMEHLHKIVTLKSAKSQACIGTLKAIPETVSHGTKRLQIKETESINDLIGNIDARKESDVAREVLKNDRTGNLADSDQTQVFPADASINQTAPDVEPTLGKHLRQITKSGEDDHKLLEQPEVFHPPEPSRSPFKPQPPRKKKKGRRTKRVPTNTVQAYDVGGGGVGAAKAKRKSIRQVAPRAPPVPKGPENLGQIRLSRPAPQPRVSVRQQIKAMNDFQKSRYKKDPLPPIEQHLEEQLRLRQSLKFSSRASSHLQNQSRDSVEVLAAEIQKEDQRASLVRSSIGSVIGKLKQLGASILSLGSKASSKEAAKEIIHPSVKDILAPPLPLHQLKPEEDRSLEETREEVKQESPEPTGMNLLSDITSVLHVKDKLSLSSVPYQQQQQSPMGDAQSNIKNQIPQLMKNVEEMTKTPNYAELLSSNKQARHQKTKESKPQEGTQSSHSDSRHLASPDVKPFKDESSRATDPSPPKSSRSHEPHKQEQPREASLRRQNSSKAQESLEGLLSNNEMANDGLSLRIKSELGAEKLRRDKPHSLLSRQYSDRIGSATSKYISQKGTIKEVILETEESVKDSNGASPNKTASKKPRSSQMRKSQLTERDSPQELVLNMNRTQEIASNSKMEVRVPVDDYVDALEGSFENQPVSDAKESEIKIQEQVSEVVKQEEPQVHYHKVEELLLQEELVGQSNSLDLQKNEPQPAEHEPSPIPPSASSSKLPSQLSIRHSRGESCDQAKSAHYQSASNHLASEASSQRLPKAKRTKELKFRRKSNKPIKEFHPFLNASSAALSNDHSSIDNRSEMKSSPRSFQVHSQISAVSKDPSREVSQDMLKDAVSRDGTSNFEPTYFDQLRAQRGSSIARPNLNLSKQSGIGSDSASDGAPNPFSLHQHKQPLKTQTNIGGKGFSPRNFAMSNTHNSIWNSSALSPAAPSEKKEDVPDATSALKVNDVEKQIAETFGFKYSGIERDEKENKPLNFGVLSRKSDLSFAMYQPAQLINQKKGEERPTTQEQQWHL